MRRRWFSLLSILKPLRRRYHDVAANSQSGRKEAADEVAEQHGIPLSYAGYNEMYEKSSLVCCERSRNRLDIAEIHLNHIDYVCPEIAEDAIRSLCVCLPQRRI